MQNIQNTQVYSTEIPFSDTTFVGASSPRNPNERWTAYLNPNLPIEPEMTVFEAEQSDNFEQKYLKISPNFIFYFIILIIF